MQTIDFINTHGIDSLSRFGIKYKKHDKDGRVILNYDQIESRPYKTHPLVKECRALILDSDNGYKLVSRSFERFFNIGEVDQSRFDWNNCKAYHKEDGSLICVYYWNDSWHLSTRNSFGNGEINYSGITWRELFELAFPNWQEKLEKGFTYVFELCSRYNKIVRDYPEPSVFLLTVFKDSVELTHETTEYFAIELGVDIPKVITIYDEMDAESYIAKLAQEDSTFEGLVLRDGFNLRLKAKSSEYVALHRLSNNGNLVHPKNILPFILKGEEDEVLQYFPEIREKTVEIKQFVDTMKQELDDIWFCHCDQRNQKKFAMAVKDHKLSGYLFSARTNGTDPLSELNKSPELLLKVLMNEIC